MSIADLLHDATGLHKFAFVGEWEPDSDVRVANLISDSFDVKPIVRQGGRYWIANEALGSTEEWGLQPHLVTPGAWDSENWTLIPDANVREVVAPLAWGMIPGSPVNYDWAFNPRRPLSGNNYDGTHAVFPVQNTDADGRSDFYIADIFTDFPTATATQIPDMCMYYGAHARIEDDDWAAIRAELDDMPIYSCIELVNGSQALLDLGVVFADDDGYSTLGEGHVPTAQWRTNAFIYTSDNAETTGHEEYQTSVFVQDGPRPTVPARSGPFTPSDVPDIDTFINLLKGDGSFLAYLGWYAFGEDTDGTSTFVVAHGQGLDMGAADTTLGGDREPGDRPFYAVLDEGGEDWVTDYPPYPERAGTIGMTDRYLRAIIFADFPVPPPVPSLTSGPGPGMAHRV